MTQPWRAWIVSNIDILDFFWVPLNLCVVNYYACAENLPISQQRCCYGVVGVIPAWHWAGTVRLARHHPHRTHNPLSGSQDHHPYTNWVQKTISCNLTSSAPDDRHMRPKHFKLRKLQEITLLHQVGISLYFMMKMHGQTTLKFTCRRFTMIILEYIHIFS